MRYLSPTSLKLFLEDRNTFYIQYICKTRTARPPQTVPMSVGSAFDAYVKSYLVERLIGKQPEFEFSTIFTSQVEPHNRDTALKDGLIVFEAYKAQGGLADLLIDLEGAVGKPKFETAIEGYVSGVGGQIGDVPFLGKPDIFFITKKGARVIFDWKVNGFYSNYNKSPNAGYVRIRTKDKDNGRQHTKAMVMDHNGIKIAVNYPLCQVDRGWAAQLSIYAWLLGEAIGSNFIVAIDQIACGWKDGVRDLRIAQHRAIVTEGFQQQVYNDAHKAWYLIQSGHIFDNLTREQSDAHCKTLDLMAESPPDDNFNEIVR